MEIRKRYVEYPSNKRAIVISDIHGNLALFKKLLRKVGFSKDDYLFILGDIIEKGPENLETLRYIMNLSGNIHCLMGNCDYTYRYIFEDLDNEMLMKYVFFRKESILHEMCKILNIELTKDSDLKEVNKILRKEFSKEFQWLHNLPHIMETENYLFAHGGINQGETNALNIMKNDAFMSKGISFDKYLFLGHWPTCNYNKEIVNCNPIINNEQKIVSIDGGNVLKLGGQLNALIIENSKFTYEYVDELEECTVINSQQILNQTPININWGDSEIELLKDGGTFKLCRHIPSNHEIRIPSKWIYESDNKTYCYDCTDYFLPLEAGDKVGLVETFDDLSLVKKNGIIGWVKTSDLSK